MALMTNILHPYSNNIVNTDDYEKDIICNSFDICLGGLCQGGVATAYRATAGGRYGDAHI